MTAPQFCPVARCETHPWHSDEPCEVVEEHDPCVCPGVCSICDGAGGWSENVETSSGREVDIDHDCRECGGSGTVGGR